MTKNKKQKSDFWFVYVLRKLAITTSSTSFARDFKNLCVKIIGPTSSPFCLWIQQSPTRA